MPEQNNDSVLWELDYGDEAAIDRDVDLFEAFYGQHFRDKARSAFIKREGSKYRVLAVALLLGSFLFVIPILVNASSIFAYILLAMGCGAFIVGVVCARRALSIEEYCDKNFDRLLTREFAATRSKTKRIFKLRVYEDSLSVEFGTGTAISQKRSKRFDDIEHIYITDDLIFIEGLTWLSRFQLTTDQFATLSQLGTN